MVIGWGIFVAVLAFSLGVIAGAVGVTMITLRAAIKRVGTNGRLEELTKSIKDRAERIEKMKTEVANLSKRSPRPIPTARIFKCGECSNEWRSGLSENTGERPRCPVCFAKNTFEVGGQTETPFIGEPS